MDSQIKLLPHQEDAVKYGSTKNSIPLLCPMGTGKTAMSLSICMQRQFKKVLCVVPKAVINGWVKDIGIFTNYSCAVATGNKQKRIEALLSPVEIILINFEGARILEDELVKMASKNYFDCIIIDELARVRRYSEQTKALQKITKHIPTKIGLTALLLAESELDAYNPFLILDNGRTFGTDFFAFRAKYFTKEDTDSGYPTYTITDYGKRIISGLIKQNSFILDEDKIQALPNTSFNTRQVALSAEQLKFLKLLEEEWSVKIAELNHEEQLKYTIQVIQKSLQCISGFNYLPNGETFWFDYNPKIQELNAIVEENGNLPFVVWCNYKAERALVEKLLTSIGKTICPQEESAKFDSSNYDCYIGTYAKDAQGINLKRARTSILFSRPNSYEKYYQALGRNRRQNSEYKLISYQLISSRHPIEIINDKALKKKEELSLLLKDMDLKDIWKLKK